MLVLYQLLLKCSKCQYVEQTVSLLFSTLRKHKTRPTRINLKVAEYQISDIHDFTLYCYLRDQAVLNGFGLACTVFKYCEISSVNYLPSRSYRTAIARTYFELYLSCMLDEELLAA